MFTKLFNKQPERSEWVAWFCLIESKPASVSADCLAYNDKTSKLQSLVVLILKNLGTSRNGFPTKELFDELYSIEDKIAQIANNNNSKYPGRFITDGAGYYLVYTNSPDSIKSKLQDLMSKIEKFSFDISVREGKNWKDYYEMLYPPKKEKQRYHNSILIKHILQEGDNPEKTREIVHAIFFASNEAREEFLKELKKMKFPIEKFELAEHKDIDLPYTLELKVLSPLKIDILNSSTDTLISLAEKFHASYDGWGAEIKR